MHHLMYCLRSRLRLILPIFSGAPTTLIYFLAVTSPSFAQTSRPADGIHLSYRAQLEFYLDRKSRDFLVDMAGREQALVQLIEVVSREVRQRGVRAVSRDEAGFRELYHEAEELITQYSNELDQVMKLIDDIDRLKDTVSREKNQQMIEEVGDLKDRLVALLEDRELYQQAPYTASRVTTMLAEYKSEVDSLLSIYDRLERFERLATRRGDREIVSEIDTQKQRIAYILNQWRGAPAVNDKMASEYLSEAQKLVRVLQQLEDLGERALQHEGDEVGIEVEALRREILSSLDARLLDLFGYGAAQKFSGPTVTEMLSEWKAQRFASFEAKRTEYEIVRARLLQTGTEQERTRMLQRELADAMLNYADGNYLTSEIELSSILEAYKPYFQHLDAAIFYRSESLYARKMLQLARPGYIEILDQYPQSDYIGESYLRLLNITHTLDEDQVFRQYYRSMMAKRTSFSRELRTHADYLAGFHFLHEDSLDQAERALSLVGKGSKYYFPAQYLLAIAYLRNDVYDKAKESLLMLADKGSYPWSDNNTAVLRNNALLKLGFLEYEKGNYQAALKYFHSVSKGYSHFDQSLLGIAWASLKQSSYDSTIAAVAQMMHDYLASDYTYEALVLSAHAKRLLDRGDDAMKDLRYVSTSRGVLDVTKEYNEERRYILSLLDQVQRMEDSVLDRRDRQLYETVSEIRDQVMASLRSFSYRGIVGRRLLNEYSEERQAVLKQIEELDNLIQNAKEHQMDVVLRDAKSRRERLVRTLDTYGVNESVQNVNYFIDYPLATREAISTYRKGIYDTVVDELQAEQKRLQDAMSETRSLLASGDGSAQGQVRTDLELLHQDLGLLRKRLDRFRTWVNEHPVQPVDTQFDLWADFSGFGLSDITFDRIRKADQRISSYAENIGSINSILEQKQKQLEHQLSEYDAEMRRIEKEMKEQKIQAERQRREEYFRQSYFDVSATESNPQTPGEPAPPPEEKPKPNPPK